jgi:hypothetical protein
MRLDSLVRAIEAADFSAFREIALVSLKLRGFQPSLSDGPHDGGADFLVYVLAPNEARFAVQVSVEKNWQRKLRADAAKARKRLHIENLLFISSRVITEPVFQELADDLLRQFNIQVRKTDAKDLASQAMRSAFTHDILHILGIDVPAPAARPFQRPDLRQDVAYACAFFGTEAQAFRKTVVENGVMAAVFQAGGSAERETVTARTMLSLGLASNQGLQVASAIDRMLQEGRLSSKNGSVTLDTLVRDNWATANALQHAELIALHTRVDALLAPYVKNATKRRDAIDAFVEDLGALWLQMGRVTSDALDATELSTLAQGPLRDRLRHLDAILDTLGVVDAGTRTKLLHDSCALAADSTFGRALTAGEIFINLVSMRTPHVFRALGGVKELCTILDTSVAMPLLSSLLYDSAEQDYFVAAKHAYDQLIAHGASLVLPKDYLEEIASHLLAALNYRQIVDMDPDLRGSSNAFVAHYVALSEAEGDKVESYASYLAGFGVRQAPSAGDPVVARDVLMSRLQRNDLERPLVLVRHDATTLGWLLDHASDPDIAYVICTWDKLHPYVQNREAAEWDVLDPVALGDVLSLASPGNEDVKFISPVFVALTMSAEAERKGAAVWDRLVELEKERLHDAPLRKAAAAFKQDWVELAAKDRRPQALQEAWEAWKAAHLDASAK